MYLHLLQENVTCRLSNDVQTTDGKTPPKPTKKPKYSDTFQIDDDEIEDVCVETNFIKKHYALDKQRKTILSCDMIRVESDQKNSTSYDFAALIFSNR